MGGGARVISDMAALIGAAVSLLGLGLVMGTSPTLYAIVMKMLSTTTRPVRTVAWITVGVAIGTTVLLFVFRLVDPETITELLEARAERFLIRRTVDLVAAGLFIAAGVWMLTRLRRPRGEPKPAATPRTEAPPLLIATGTLNALIGVSGMATMYITGRVIASASRDLLVEAGLYAIFLVAVVGPYLLLAVLWARYPGLGHRIRDVTDRFSHLDLRPLLAVALIVAGVVFAVLGLLGPDTPDHLRR